MDQTFLTTDSVLYDAVYLASGQQSVNALKKINKVNEFLMDAYNHFKAIGAPKEAADLVAPFVRTSNGTAGVITSASDEPIKKSVEQFIEAVGKHRHWDRIQ